MEQKTVVSYDWWLWTQTTGELTICLGLAAEISGVLEESVWENKINLRSSGSWQQVRSLLIKRHLPRWTWFITQKRPQSTIHHYISRGRFKPTEHHNTRCYPNVQLAHMLWWWQVVCWYYWFTRFPRFLVVQYHTITVCAILSLCRDFPHPENNSNQRCIIVQTDPVFCNLNVLPTPCHIQQRIKLLITFEGIRCVETCITEQTPKWSPSVSFLVA